MSQTKAQLIAGTSTQDVTFDDATVNSLNGGPLSGARNRIINGDMRIDQRNAGASVTPTAAVYGIDRWQFHSTAASKYSFQRNAGSVTPPSGFVNYLGITSLSAYTVSASDVFAISQQIEGFNAADLNWGAASAATVTLSFWVRSSLTGSFGGAISNSAQNRSYAFSYQISSASTWEYKTITIPGDTSGTWLNDNGVGLSLRFGLGTGSTFSGVANSWTASNLWSTTGATSVVGTNGATFFITGVQLEPGSVATPFERRSYGQELALCQRYYWQDDSANAYYVANAAAGNIRFSGAWVVTMRANPTLTYGPTHTTNPGSITTNGWTSVLAVTGTQATQIKTASAEL